MSNEKIKKVGAIVGSIAIAGSSAVLIVPAITSGAQTPIAQVSTDNNASSTVKVAHADGTFAYTQDKTTSNAEIHGVFGKALATMCSMLPDYNVDELDGAIAVGGNVPNPYVATVDEMADSSDAQTFVLACACASNLAGGKAVANAEVTGVSLESIATTAGAR